MSRQAFMCSVELFYPLIDSGFYEAFYKTINIIWPSAYGTAHSIGQAIKYCEVGNLAILSTLTISISTNKTYYLLLYYQRWALGTNVQIILIFIFVLDSIMAL